MWPRTPSPFAEGLKKEPLKCAKFSSCTILLFSLMATTKYAEQFASFKKVSRKEILTLVSTSVIHVPTPHYGKLGSMMSTKGYPTMARRDPMWVVLLKTTLPSFMHMMSMCWSHS